MPNTTATPQWVTNEIGYQFSNEVNGVAAFNRTYDGQFRQAGAKVGDTIKVRKPQRWQVTDGSGYQGQAILDQTVPVTLSNQKGVHFDYSSVEGTTDLDDIRARYVQPAAEAMANAADVLGMANVYKDVYNYTGTLGTTPATAVVWGDAGSAISYGAVPLQRRVAVLDIKAMFRTSQINAAFFNPQGTVSQNWRSGQMGANQLGIAEWYQSQNVPKFTSGVISVASTPVVDTAGQTGSAITTSGWGNSGLAAVKGDIVTFAGVYKVNPQSFVSTGQLQQFVLTADAADDGSGNATLNISPSIITSGPLQTVTASPALNAVVTYWAMSAGGTQAAYVSPQSLVFHRDAFAFVMADMIMPNGGAKATFARSKKLNVSIRYVQQYQSLTDQNLNRLDMLIGAATIWPDAACRVVG